MSGAFWFFFWSGADSWEEDADNGLDIPIPAPRANSGGGGKKEKFPAYDALGDDFWLERKKYLEKSLPKKPEPPEVPEEFEDTPGFDSNAFLLELAQTMLQRQQGAS